MRAFDALVDTAGPVLDQVKELRRNLGRLKNEARKAYAEAEKQMDEAATRLGLPTKRAPTIDVGARPSAIGRAVRAAGSALALALALSALVSLFAFCLQIFLAFLLVTRGLGLRVDVGGAARGT
jgi:hypothetical protein